MKYSNQVIIDAPIDKVVELFDSTDNAYKWMEGLKKHEQIEGKPGEQNSKMKMYFDLGKNKIEIVETILERDLPRIFNADYYSNYSTNNVVVSFEELDSSTTRYNSETTVTTHGFMMKIMSWVMPGMFKKQSQKYMDDFKAFVERQ